MRLPGLLCTGVCLVADLASADPTPAELQAQGEDLAKQGRFSEAIAGGITVGAGFVSWAVLGYGWNTLRNASPTEYPKHSESPTVMVAPTRDGGMVSLGWVR